MTADPTARDLLRIAVDYADQARALGESFDGPRRQERFGSLLRVADTFGNLARAAVAVEAGEPDVRIDGDGPFCGDCGHVEGLHMGPTGCLRCNRYGGMCESVDRKLNRPVESGSLVDVDALREHVNLGPHRRLRPEVRPANRGPFIDDDPTRVVMPVVRPAADQPGPFGPLDDATAEIPRKATWSDDRCKVTNLGRRCLLVAGHLEGPNGRGHAFAPTVPAGPDRFA